MSVRFSRIEQNFGLADNVACISVSQVEPFDNPNFIIQITIRWMAISASLSSLPMFRRQFASFLAKPYLGYPPQ